MPIHDEKVCDRIRKARDDRGLSQSALGARAGFKGNTAIYRIEAGKTSPSANTLLKIAHALNVDLYWLLTGDDSPIVKTMKEEHRIVLETLAKYISHETARLLDKRHELWGELGVTQEKQSRGIVGTDEYVHFLESEIKRIEEKVADVAEDQHYVQDALSNIRL